MGPRTGRRARGGLAVAGVALVASAVSVLSGGFGPAAHATAQGPAASSSGSGGTHRAGAASALTPGASPSTTTRTALHRTSKALSGATGGPASRAPLDAAITGIVAGIPPQWKAPGWTYAIVATTPNGAFGDTWGGSPPVSQFSRSQLTPLLATAGGLQTVKMVVLHEAENAKAYSVVDADNWSDVPGWPATFASEVVLEPGYDDVDAAANCLELGALGFQLAPSSGYAEEDIVGGCSPALAAWLTQQVADAGQPPAPVQFVAAAADQGGATSTPSGQPSTPAPTPTATPAPAAPEQTSEVIYGPGTAALHVTSASTAQLVVTDQVSGVVLLDQPIPAGGDDYSLVLTNGDTDSVTVTFSSGGGGLSISGVN